MYGYDRAGVMLDTKAIAGHALRGVMYRIMKQNEHLGRKCGEAEAAASDHFIREEVCSHGPERSLSEGNGNGV